MLLDFQVADLQHKALPRTVVIGSGPVGLAVAMGLRRRGIAVTLLEGGPEIASASDEFNDGDISGLPFTGVFKRGRGLGGGTSQWAGQCLRFHAADFARRDWVAESGWPIGYDALAPFYSEAEEFFDVTADGYLARVWHDFGLEPGSLVDPDVYVRFSVFARKPQVFERDRGRWERDPDCLIVYNGMATQLQRDGSRVKSITVRSRGGKSLTIPVDLMVLCLGGIETPRMLLEATPDFPHGIAGGNPHVGKHLQDHPHMVIGRIESSGSRADITRYLSSFYRRGRRYLPRLVLSASRQQELEVLNACGIALFEWPEDSVTQNLRELQSAISGHRFDLSLSSRIARTLKEPRALSRTARARLRGDSFGEVPTAINLEGYVEQDPSTASCVTLSDRLDPHGRPLASVKWTVGDFERRALVNLGSEVDSYLRRNGVGRVVMSETLRDASDAWQAGLGDNQHHVGTARMAKSVTDGVVDSNCKYFGLNNLFLCGGAVMPTGSHANPTLTMTALGFRLAAHLGKERNVLRLQDGAV